MIYPVRTSRPSFTLLTFIVTLLLIGFALPVQAQADLAATLEVLQAGVEIQRVNTTQWLPVRVEGIVGVGDTIRTDATGRARITFFADGTDTELLPGTEYRIQTFNGNDTTFNLTAEVLIGQTLQRLNRLLDANSSYNILTPGMGLVARGTQFAIRVEDGGRSAMLVQEGTVEAEPEETPDTPDERTVTVAAGFGVRAEEDAPLSDVVQATTFDQLDAALDGCPAVLTTPDDVSLNVREGPSLEAAIIGYLPASEVTLLFGQVEEAGWYRVPFADSATGFGWVLSSTVEIDETCAGLRGFESVFIEGDAAEAGVDAAPAAEATAQPTPDSP